MKVTNFTTYKSAQISDFEDAFHQSKLQYSFRSLAIIGDVSQKDLAEALQKILQLCHLAQLNIKHHFKQIYVFEPKSQTLRKDCLMSKLGFNCLIMQIPLLNEKTAHWLLRLADVSA